MDMKSNEMNSTIGESNSNSKLGTHSTMKQSDFQIKIAKAAAIMQNKKAEMLLIIDENSLDIQN
mgnify:CR=1 FL=1